MFTRQYNYEKDYEDAYHWRLVPWKISDGGFEYFEYANFIIHLISKISPRTILDIGCGDGRITDMIAQSIKGAEVLGIDISHNAIKWAKKYSKYAKFECVSLEEMSRKGITFELVTMIEVLEHLESEQARQWIENILPKLTMKCGRIIITVPTINFPMIHEGHKRHFSRESMNELFKNTLFSITNYYWMYDMQGCWRFGRGNFIRQLVRLIDNKYWNIRPLTKVLADIHRRRYRFSSEERAGRMVVQLERSSTAL